MLKILQIKTWVNWNLHENIDKIVQLYFKVFFLCICTLATLRYTASQNFVDNL